MREYEFRAWNKKKKIMVYKNEDNSADYLDGVCLSDIELVNVRLKDNFEYEWMQYTGQKDKNGVKVFEGDIKDLTGDREHLVVVTWNSETCAFCAKSINGELSDHLYGGQLSEVIGNICENPELLA